MISLINNMLVKSFDNELLIIEPWGDNALRVRAFPDRKKVDYSNALLEVDTTTEVKVIKKSENEAVITNGKIKAVLDHRDRITFYNDKNEEILKEFIRLRAVKHDDGSEDVSTIEITKDFNSTLKLKSREYRANVGGDFHIKTRFESDNKEKIFGMGQYQQDYLNLKGCQLELAQRNTQMSIPFYVSNKNYGFLWNNPGLGTVTFAKNLTEWDMPSTFYIDYWITVGENPKEILNSYANATGKVPLMPKNLLGLWQSKLRYRTQDEIMEIVKKYKDKGVQLSTIAIDYFHWPHQGEYQFDKKYWPNPEKMVSELKNKYHVEPLISIWPTVQSDAENYNDFLENGYLINVNRGVRLTMQIQGSTIFVDTTNEKATDYVWGLINKNYKKIGINYFWIDVAEPGYAVYDFDNYRYYKGTVQQVGNLYPIGYLKMIYNGLQKTNTTPVTLVRGAWAGAQRFGALAWSGDIDSSFESLRNQVNTGINVGLSGMPWWTTDIGGFHGGNPEDQEFRELMIRWFQYAVFSPVLRMHGDRLPHSAPLSNSGGGSMPTGAPNEIWSYGEVAEKIFLKYLKVREYLKDYIYSLMKDAHESGNPIMRPLFYEYPEDQKSWEVENIYLLGDSILVAPILYYKQRNREIYLPKGSKWINPIDNQIYQGGQIIELEAPLDEIPILINENKLSDFTELICFLKGE
ncbi:TIM-barrel domain-containing protein [Streptococcus pluranimalium]|uniref:glycoside hydrolase family 31 protein n=1 Tax=Streptococcus pluranimalium TaxID=82348 RepID=UPI003F66314F